MTPEQIDKETIKEIEKKMKAWPVGYAEYLRTERIKLIEMREISVEQGEWKFLDDMPKLMTPEEWKKTN